MFEKLGRIVRHEVLLVSEGGQVGDDHRVGELQPFGFVAVIDEVPFLEVVAILGFIVHFEILDGFLSPCAHLRHDFRLVVVIVGKTARFVGLFHRRFAVVFGQAVPGEGLAGVADTGHRPGFILDRLVDQVFKVHALEPVGHTPQFSAGIRSRAVVVAGKSRITARTHHL